MDTRTERAGRVVPLPADVNDGRFVATPEGQRFRVPFEMQEPKRPVMMMMTLNWLEALKSRTATRK